MANEKYKGRDFLLYMEDTPNSGTYTLCGGMRSTSLSINNAAVDVTDKEGAPWRELLEAGIKTLDITLAGVMKNQVMTRKLMAAVMATDGTTIQNFKLVSGFGDQFVGKFQIGGFDRAGEHAGEETYSIKLASSGAPAYTPAP